MADDQFAVFDISLEGLSKFCREQELFAFKKNQKLMETMIDRYLGSQDELIQCRLRIEFLEQKLKKKGKKK